MILLLGSHISGILFFRLIYTVIIILLMKYLLETKYQKFLLDKVTYTELINDPLYSIALFPNDSFIDDLNRFKKKNDLDMSDIKTNFNIHYIIKAPFYLSHLNDENEIIKKFNKSNFKLLKNILNKSFEFESIEKINNFHSAKFKGDEEFNFFKLNNERI